MLLTFQARLRIPWQGGSKKISLGTAMPIFLLPIGFAIASVNAYCAGICLTSGAIGLGFAYRYAQKALLRTRFFFMWVLCSVFYMVAVFQLKVPLLLVLVEENLVLVFLAVSSIFCLYRAKQRATQNFVLQSAIAEDELPDIAEASTTEEEEDGISRVTQSTALLIEDELDDAAAALSRNHTRPRIPDSSQKYCQLCSACILRHDHHSYWLDCCIGKYNHRYYLGGLLFAEMALLIGANIVLTSVCHPFSVFRFLSIPIVLPDDCSEVFFLYESSVLFVIALYALLMATYISVVILSQLYFILHGITMHEWCNGQRGNRRPCLINFRAFMF